jgi:hypothetical protein
VRAPLHEIRDLSGADAAISNIFDSIRFDSILLGRTKKYKYPSNIPLFS